MSTDRPVYAFGPFRLDLQQRVLLRDDAPIALTPKALAILSILVERRGRIVDKADLMEAVWPDTAVEEGNLTQNVHLLRKTLGPQSECGIVVETVPRRGYRLTGTVTVVAADTSAPAEMPQTTVTVKRRRWGAPALATVLCVGVAGIGYWAAERSSARSTVLPETVATVSRGLRPLNSLPGDKASPALSPDGDRLAFVWDRGQGHNVYVAHVGTGAALQVTDGPGGTETPAWSPDGRSIAYVRKFFDSDGVARRGVFITSATGGTPDLVWVRPTTDYAAFAAAGLDWSPDGSLLAFSAPLSSASAPQIVLVSTSDGTSRSPVSAPGPGEHDEYPVFSPDGTTVAFVRGGSKSRIMVQKIAGGTVKVLPVVGHAVRRLAWTVDGKSLVFESEQTRRLWIASVTSGEVVPVPDLGEGAKEPSIARRTGQLVYRQLRRDINVVRADLRAGMAPSIHPLASTNLTDRHGTISPDGSRVAFVSDRTGTGEIWVMHSDGDAPRQLTDLRTSAVHPQWSADGRSIAFAANPPGSRHRCIFVVDVENGVTRRLTADPSLDSWPTWSHDGAAVYYTSNRSGEWAAWRVPSSGGQPEQVSEGPARKAVESPDGTYLYYSSPTPSTIWRRPIGGGPLTAVMTLAPKTGWGGEWRVTERGIYWVDERQQSSSIAFHDFQTNRSSVVMTLPPTYHDGGGFSVSSDGRWVIFGQRDYDASDLLLVEAMAPRPLGE